MVMQLIDPIEFELNKCISNSPKGSVLEVDPEYCKNYVN